jgi:CRP-like cAMP-binding protein
MPKRFAEELSWVKRGKQRREIIVHIDDSETPTEIAEKSGYSLNNTSRVLGDFRRRGIARCLNPKEKTGRLYDLKPVGKLIRDKLRKKK